MKQTFLILAICSMTSIAITGQANNTINFNIPESVTIAFSKQYPNSSVYKWEKSEDSFIAKFVTNQKLHEITFGVNGNWVQTKTVIKLEELPMHIVNAYFSNITAWENWTSAREVISPDYKITYIIIGDNEEDESDPLYEFQLHFTSNGELIKRLSNE